MAVYPNPLSANSLVELDLPARGEATIALYDVSGRKVASIHAGPLDAGTHRFSLSGYDFPKGTYFCRATGEGWSRVVKCVGI